jgi:hypothetical protein
MICPTAVEVWASRRIATEVGKYRAFLCRLILSFNVLGVVVVFWLSQYWSAMVASWHDLGYLWLTDESCGQLEPREWCRHIGCIYLGYMRK